MLVSLPQISWHSKAPIFSLDATAWPQDPSKLLLVTSASRSQIGQEPKRLGLHFWQVSAKPCSDNDFEIVFVSKVRINSPFNCIRFSST
ncbi:MAG: hypothetical protein MHPSP_004403, partial [Paramarteilia canceri]